MDDFLQHKQHQFCKSRQNSPKEKKNQIVRMALFMVVLLNTKDYDLHVLVHRIHRKVLAKYDGQCFLRQATQVCWSWEGCSLG